MESAVPPRKLVAGVYSLAAALLLTACGGGGGGGASAFLTPIQTPIERQQIAEERISEQNAGQQQTAKETAGPGTTDEQQRLLAQREQEREENDAAWQRHLDTLEPEIRAEQAARRLKCQTANQCLDTFLSQPVTIVYDRQLNGALVDVTKTGGAAYNYGADGNSAGNAFFNFSNPGSFNPADFPDNQSFRIGFRWLDLADDDEYLHYGVWRRNNSSTDLGGFAIGAEFSAAEIAALPTTGTATYRGEGGIYAAPGRNNDSQYRVLAEFTANFAANDAHTLSGTLTENFVVGRTLFSLNLGESTFRNGEFADGAVTCGEGACSGGGGLYNAKFFGTADGDGRASKLGGTFKAVGLNLDNRGAKNVVGAFGAELQ